MPIAIFSPYISLTKVSAAILITLDNTAIGMEKKKRIVFLVFEARIKYAITAPKAIKAISDLIPEQGSSTTRYECIVFITLPSLIARTPKLFTIIVAISDARIFNLKLKLEIETNGKGTIKARNRIGNKSCFKKMHLS